MQWGKGKDNYVPYIFVGLDIGTLQKEGKLSIFLLNCIITLINKQKT